MYFVRFQKKRKLSCEKKPYAYHEALPTSVGELYFRTSVILFFLSKNGKITEGRTKTLSSSKFCNEKNCKFRNEKIAKSIQM